jgi:anthranilate phosphoribosyltransferase
MLEFALKIVEAGRDLSMDQMSEAIGLIMEGRCGEDQIARLLAALHGKGETVAEVAGAASAMRRHMTPIHHKQPVLIDTCGTGGDGSRTFNISTAAALVTAAAGVPVAKHGNRGITSRSGSADVLAVLGVNVEADVAVVESCLDELGICFCFAPLLHRAMKHVAAVRKRLPHPTIFNILGPLVNPASAPLQLLGVGKPKLQSLLAEALALLGTRRDCPNFRGENGTVPFEQRALVVHGSDGLDEVTLGGITEVIEVCNEPCKDDISKAEGQTFLSDRARADRNVCPPEEDRHSHFHETANGYILRYQWRPADFGLAEAGRESMLVENPQQSAEIIRGILDGSRGTPRDIVVANAAAAIWIARRAASLLECVRQAAAAIDCGAARDLLAQLVKITKQKRATGIDVNCPY